MSEKCVLFFEKSEVIFTKLCFIFVLFFDKSDYDHCILNGLINSFNRKIGTIYLFLFTFSRRKYFGHFLIAFLNTFTI